MLETLKIIYVINHNIILLIIKIATLSRLIFQVKEIPQTYHPFNPALQTKYVESGPD